MTFLHYSLLAFLPLAAMPIILHLLTLHRFKTVELSTFRFLFDTYIQQRRRLRLLEAILAALRTLFLLLLVLAICRPAIRPWRELFGERVGKEVLMLVDCSASMNAHTAGQSALDQAKSAAMAIVERLDEQDRLTLIRVANRPEEVFSRFSSDVDSIHERIESLQASPSRANLFTTFSLLFGPEAPQRVDPTVYLLTDCQASGWSELRDQSLDKIIPEKTHLIVVNVGSREPIPNRAVVGEAPRWRRAIVGLPLVLRPRVTNDAASESAQVTISTLLDETQVARTTLVLKPGESKSSEVVFVPTQPGDVKGRFEITSTPQDRFPDDDSYLFALSVSPAIKVVLIDGNAGGLPLESEALYLRTALTTTRVADEEHEIPADLQVDEAYRQALSIQEISESELNAETLRDASVVILADCGSLRAAQFGLLRDFVMTGGGLMIFPGERVNPSVYNTQFFPVPGPQGDRLTFVRLEAPEGDPKDPKTFESLGSVDLSHPVLAIFDKPKSRYLSTVRFYRRFPLKPPDDDAGADWRLAEFHRGTPALVESRLGEGVVLLAAFPANTKWSNLPMKPEFVPLVLRMVAHVEHRPDVDLPSVVPAGAPAEVAVADSWAPVTGEVVDVASRATALTFERSGARMLAAFEETAEKGYYNVKIDGGTPRSPQHATAAFAVNLAADESNFEMVDEAQIRTLLTTADVTMIDASAEAQQIYGSVGTRQEVWRPLILLTFLIIGVEFLLATLGGQQVGDEEPKTVAQRLRDLSPETWAGRMTGAGSTAEDGG